MPNPNTLPYYHYQDIQIPDVALQTQFMQYVKNGQYTEALSLLTTNATQLWGKSYIADTINTIMSGVLELEDYFHSGVTLFLTNLSNQYNTLISNFKMAGTWNSSSNYIPYNFVFYNQELYMCIQENTNTIPTNTSYWLYLGLQGKQGVPGINVNMKYTWKASNNYQTNDLVVYNNNVYVALVANSGVTPGTDENTWLLFWASEEGQIYVGLTAPTMPIQNTIWMQTVSDPLTANASDGAIIGQLKYYNTDIDDWDEMYPNTVFTLVDDYNNYTNTAFFISIDIQPNEWVNNTYTYSSSLLTTNTIVNIFPQSDISEAQYLLYNQLTLNISAQNIVLNIPSSPTLNIPIIIKIQ